MRRLASLLAAAGLLATAAGCSSSHDAHPRSSDDRLRSASYSGHLYSVRQVRRAFAALGLELHAAGRRGPGLVLLVNNARLGPDHIPSPPRVVTVLVATRREAAGSRLIRQGRGAQVIRFANIAVFAKPDWPLLDQARGAVSALRWGIVPRVPKPSRHLIVLGSSIGDIWLGESRRDVEKKFGPGHAIQRGLVSYFGGHLLVNYWFHDAVYPFVTYLQTQWKGFTAPSGVHVGSTRRELRPLYVTCIKRDCILEGGPWPDPVGTEFTMRHGKVAGITVGSLG